MGLADELLKKYPEISPLEFYRDIFPDNELDTDGSVTPGKYCGIIIEKTDKQVQRKDTAGNLLFKADGSPKMKDLVYRHYLFDELDIIDELAQKSPYFCFLSPISYAGKSRTGTNARFMYALCVEIDGLCMSYDGKRYVGLENLINNMDIGVIGFPCPTYIVSSGNGLHLYYVFEKAIPMFKNVSRSLSNFKDELTRKLWNEHITDLWRSEDMQIESILQGFRMVGGLTKRGVERVAAGKKLEYGDRCRAYKTGKKVSIDYMNQFCRNKIELIYKTDLTLAQAKKLYPEWYQNRIVEGKAKGHYSFNRAVYDRWKKRMLSGQVTGGHRYNCLMILAINAKKCSEASNKNPNPVTYEELEADAWDVAKHMKKIKWVRKGDNKPDDFTDDDVMDALEAFNDTVWTYPVNSIINRSGIQIEKNKRNGQKQEWHLEDIRIKKMKMKERGKKFKNPEGRPKGSTKDKTPKSEAIAAWRAAHPDGRKIDCERDLKISRPTILKWW